MASVTFGVLFKETIDSMPALAATLACAQKRGVVTYSGDMLMQGTSDGTYACDAVGISRFITSTQASANRPHYNSSGVVITLIKDTIEDTADFKSVVCHPTATRILLLYTRLDRTNEFFDDGSLLYSRLSCLFGCGAIDQIGTGPIKLEQKPSGPEKCDACAKTVYPTERIAANGKVMHKPCFRCCTCKIILKLSAYAFNGGKFYWYAPHRRSMVSPLPLSTGYISMPPSLAIAFLRVSNFLRRPLLTGTTNMCIACTARTISSRCSSSRVTTFNASALARLEPLPYVCQHLSRRHRSTLIHLYTLLYFRRIYRCSSFSCSCSISYLIHISFITGNIHFGPSTRGAASNCHITLLHSFSRVHHRTQKTTNAMLQCMISRFDAMARVDKCTTLDDDEVEQWGLNAVPRSLTADAGAVWGMADWPVPRSTAISLMPMHVAGVDVSIGGCGRTPALPMNVKVLRSSSNHEIQNSPKLANTGLTRPR